LSETLHTDYYSNTATDRVTINTKRLVEFFERILKRIDAVESSVEPIDATLQRCTENEEQEIAKRREYLNNPLQEYVDLTDDMRDITSENQAIKKEIKAVVKYFSEKFKLEFDGPSEEHPLFERYHKFILLDKTQLFADKLEAEGVVYHLKNTPLPDETSPLVQSFFSDVIGGFYEHVVFNIENCLQIQRSQHIRNEAKSIIEDAKRHVCKNEQWSHNADSKIASVCGHLTQHLDKMKKDLTPQQRSSLVNTLSKEIVLDAKGADIQEHAVKLRINEHFKIMGAVQSTCSSLVQ
jgi:hypothetical protein